MGKTLAVWVVLGLAACGGRDGSGPGADAAADMGAAEGASAGADASAPKDASVGDDASAGNDAGVACAVPSASDTFNDASDHGCFPTTGERVNGANACTPDEYGTTCLLGAADAGTPVPARALACRVLPLPTPFGVTFYCCPCGATLGRDAAAIPDAGPDAGLEDAYDAAEDAPASGDGAALSCGQMGDPCGPGTRCASCTGPWACGPRQTCIDVGAQ